MSVGMRRFYRLAWTYGAWFGGVFFALGLTENNVGLTAFGVVMGIVNAIAIIFVTERGRDAAERMGRRWG